MMTNRYFALAIDYDKYLVRTQGHTTNTCTLRQWLVHLNDLWCQARFYGRSDVEGKDIVIPSELLNGALDGCAPAWGF